jgi:membrane protein
MNRARLSVQERIGALERRIRRTPPVRVLMSVMDSYNAAGGGLLASGLAFSALFAVVPGLLLLVSVLVIVGDEALRTAVIDWVIDQVPPLEEVARSVVDSVANSARVGTIIGFIGFVWGASGFYLAIDGAINRFFPAPRGRDPLSGRVRGVIATGVVVFAVLVAFVASAAISVVNSDILKIRADGLLPILSPLVAIGAAWLVCLACYLLLPVRPPHWRAALVPAIVAGTAIGLLTSLFGVLAPILVGGFTSLGVIASVFIALVWLNWLFQAVLLGAAYARQRDVLQRHREAEVTRIF